jgi:hypothetical protein
VIDHSSKIEIWTREPDQTHTICTENSSEAGTRHFNLALCMLKKGLIGQATCSCRAKLAAMAVQWWCRKYVAGLVAGGAVRKRRKFGIITLLDIGHDKAVYVPSSVAKHLSVLSNERRRR